jgi:hypothetical protein
MADMITNMQMKKMAKIFRKSGRTFQNLATETCLTSIPNHITELSKEEAKEFLRCYSNYLIEPKEKQ